MSKRMRVFSLIALGAIVCILSFTVVVYSSVKEMQRNYQQTHQTSQSAVTDSSENHTPVSGAATYYYLTPELREDDYNKYGIDMGFTSAEEYELSASVVINNPDAISKMAKSGEGMIFYLESTNELVVVSEDGFIGDYFKPVDGKKYFDEH